MAVPRDSESIQFDDYSLELSSVTGEPFRTTECRRPVLLQAFSADRTTGELQLAKEVPSRCGSWSCGGCGRRLRALHIKLVVAGIEHHMAQGRFARLVTLTFPTDQGAQADNPDDVAACTALIARWVQEIRRTHSPRMEYYAVKEETKRGRLHVHMVTTGPYLRKCRHRQGDVRYDCENHGWHASRCCEAATWLDPCHSPRGCQTNPRRPCAQAIAHRLGFGFIDVRKVRGAGNAAAYVAKYLAKQVGATWPRYSHRTSYSRGRLHCDHHDNPRGARCCDLADRRTFYAPLTIAQLTARWARTSFIRGVLAGHITAPWDEPNPPTIDKWFFGGPYRAPPDTQPTNLQLTELELLHRVNHRLGAWRQAAGYGQGDPIPTTVAHQLTHTPTAPLQPPPGA